MLYLGIDAALSTTGLAIYDSSLDDIIFIDKISTKYGDIKNKEEDFKIYFICTEIVAIAMKYKVDTVVIEDQFVGFKTSHKTSMQLSRLRGAIAYALYKEMNLNLKYINTNVMKKSITEIGNVCYNKGEPKLIVYNAVRNIYNCNSLILNLGDFNDRQCKDKNSDIFDAIAIARVYANAN